MGVWSVEVLVYLGFGVLHFNVFVWFQVPKRVSPFFLGLKQVCRVSIIGAGGGQHTDMLRFRAVGFRSFLKLACSVLREPWFRVQSPVALRVHVPK